MKKFSLRSLQFLAYPVLIFLGLNFCINIVAEERPLNKMMSTKISKLPVKQGKLNIVIAGDSRAERQLIPKVIQEETGIPAINIAISNGELVTSLNAIKEHYNDKNFIYVLSISSFQINDGATSPGYLSEKAFQKASLYEKWYLYKNNGVGFIKIYGKLLDQIYHEIFNKVSYYDKNSLANQGFLGIDGYFKPFVSQKEITNYIHKHRHYENLSNNNIRWRIFKESVEKLSHLKGKTLLINPPLSAYGKEITENTVIEKAEVEYAKKVKKLSKEYENIEFLDLYNEDKMALDDSLYYDFYHLNKKGAKIYSKNIARIIKQKVVTDK